jgi:plasmid stability protein
MARPKKNDALGASAFIGIRVPPGMRKALERKAAAHGSTIATEARNAITLGLERAKRK